MAKVGEKSARCSERRAFIISCHKAISPDPGAHGRITSARSDVLLLTSAIEPPSAQNECRAAAIPCHWHGTLGHKLRLRTQLIWPAWRPLLHVTGTPLQTAASR